MKAYEKALVREMKSTYKHCGYDLSRSFSGEFKIAADRWTVRFTEKLIPRAVLALIVEHLGEIPQCGQAFHIQKRECTPMLSGVAEAPFYGITNADCNSVCKVVRTPITYQGAVIFRRVDAEGVHLVDPELLELFESALDIYQVGEKVLCGSRESGNTMIVTRTPVTQQDLQVTKAICKLFSQLQDDG